MASANGVVVIEENSLLTLLRFVHLYLDELSLPVCLSRLVTDEGSPTISFPWQHSWLQRK